MEMVENQMVAKIFLLLPFSLHVLLLEAGTSKLVFCQKLQLQLLCCLCMHCLVLVCLMGEAQHCQSRMSLYFKHSRMLQRSRIVEGTVATKSMVLYIVAKHRVTVMLQSFYTARDYLVLR